MFYQLLSRCREVTGGHGFRFKNKLLSLDATLIELCGTVFDWAQYRRTKGAVKLHLLLDHQGLLPSYAVPRDIVCVPELPKNGAGKVLKHALAPPSQGESRATAG